MSNYLDTAPDSLEVIHLNGAVWQELQYLTFSDLDYAIRLARPENWLNTCATDLLSRLVVFVGTELNESTLWQYLELRKERGSRGARELRPGSYLITPNLNPARRVMLRELNIDWIPMGAEESADQVMSAMGDAATEGHRALSARRQADFKRTRPLLVSELATTSEQSSSEYLMSQEPTWSDIQSGRAIPRDCDQEVYILAKRLLASGAVAAPLLLTGTAGSGKSTALMRLALRLTADGIATYWIDSNSNISPQELRLLTLESKDQLVFCVDDADIWGTMFIGWARELPELRSGVAVVGAMRSTRVPGSLTEDMEPEKAAVEVTMPPLSDADIDGLIEVLDRYNRLGILKGMKAGERVRAFQKEAGRQLLVAMIQATSDRLFKEKIFDEFQELDTIQRLIVSSQ